jgi:hemerythrin-like metal-binding protein
MLEIFWHACSAKLFFWEMQMELEWKEAMATGVKEIDEAHKVLIIWINRLSVEMRSNNGRQEIINGLDFLEKYAALHFSHEENCMLQLQCPSFRANKNAHAEFLEFFARMRKNIEVNGPTVKAVLEIKSVMGDWLKNHIMKIDMGLAKCVKQNNMPAVVVEEETE